MSRYKIKTVANVYRVPRKKKKKGGTFYYIMIPYAKQTVNLAPLPPTQLPKEQPLLS
jgi:hypothetical protein